jgi:hypothetical protein
MNQPALELERSTVFADMQDLYLATSASYSQLLPIEKSNVSRPRV